MDIEKVWDKVKAEDDAEYAVADPDFRAKLAHAAGEARQGRSTGIAGLEKFEEAVAKDAGATLSASGVDAAHTAGSPTVVGDRPEEDVAAKSTDGGGEAKALKDAAAAGSRIEQSEVHSPRAPSAARPMAAEAPGNAPSPSERRAASKKAGSKKTAAKKAGTKKAAKKGRK